MATAQKKSPPSDTMQFNADVSRLLNIVTNALYTDNNVFLRELVSNASDACDRLRYEAIQNPDLTQDQPNFRIHIYKDTNARTLTIVDNGIGMSKAELTDNLGTIAKSGTAALMDKLAKKDDPLKLIGQFGVGFYASFMVADHVRVISKKSGKKAINVWESDGVSGFNVRTPTTDEKNLLDGERGTAIILHLKDEGADYLIDDKIKQTIQQYSNHVNVKIFLNTPEETAKGEAQPINQASALWRQPKSELTKDDYTTFYQSMSHGFDEPLLTAHWRAEGMMEFHALLYIPTMRPWDLYDPAQKNHVKLYVRKVLISDNLDGLMYPWMRFVRGVIDSEDLPLNINRESLQHNPVLTKIKNATTKRILNDLDKLSRDDQTAFETFWGQFGAALKEGLYDADQHRDSIFKLCRFQSTTHDGWTSLDDYIDRMNDDQDVIYYMTGESIDAVKTSPQLEGFKSRGIEVLFFTDTIDDFWLQQIPNYKDKTFKSVTKGDIDFDKNTANKDDKTEQPKDDQYAVLIDKLKSELSDDVTDVRISKRLTDSPVCLIAPDGGPDMHMERVLKINQKYESNTKPVLEINPDHAMIKKLDAVNDDALFTNAATLLLDQARIIQGEPVKDTTAFVKRMSDFMVAGLD